MKKIILAFMVFAMSLSAIAADNDSTKVSKKTITPFDRFGISLQTGAGFRTKGYYPLFINNRYSYEVLTGFKLLLDLNVAYALHDESKTYKSAVLAGGGLGYRLIGNTINSSTKNTVALDVLATGGSSIGSSSWKQGYGDVGAELYFRNKQRNIGFSFGAHYRYVNSRTNDMPNMNIGYITLGFKL